MTLINHAYDSSGRMFCPPSLKEIRIFKLPKVKNNIDIPIVQILLNDILFSLDSTSMYQDLLHTSEMVSARLIFLKCHRVCI